MNTAAPVPSLHLFGRNVSLIGELAKYAGRRAHIVSDGQPCDAWMGSIGSFLFAHRAGPSGKTACQDCVRGAVWEKLDPWEREHGEDASWRGAFPLPPFSSDIARGLLDQLLDPPGPSGWFGAIDLNDFQILPFASPPAGVCPRCAAEDEHVHEDETAEKVRPGHYRSQALSDLQIDASLHVNRFVGRLGNRLLQDRQSPFFPVTHSAFDGPVGHPGQISWGGAGKTYAASVSAGICEAFERRCGVRRDLSGVGLKATRASLGATAIEPESLGLYDDEVITTDPRLQRYRDDLMLHWLKCESIDGSHSAWIPSDFIFYGKSQITIGNSNGCASGSNLAEAKLYALMELLERDAFVLHWFAMLSPRRISLETVDDVETQTLVARLGAAGAELLLFDLRTDIPIPVVLAVALRARGEYGCFSVAACAHLDPVTACRRAVQEVVNHHYRFGQRSREAAVGALRDAPQNFHLIRKLEDHALLYGNPEMRPAVEFLIASEQSLSFGETYSDWLVMRPNTLDMRDDLAFIQAELAKCGMPQIYWFNQTDGQSRRAGLSTVRVIVPGLLPLDFGHGYSRATNMPRLHEAPKSLARSELKKLHNKINAYPHPFS